MLTLEACRGPMLGHVGGPRPEEGEGGSHLLQRSQLIEMARLKRIFYLYNASVRN